MDTPSFLVCVASEENIEHNRPFSVLTIASRPRRKYQASQRVSMCITVVSSDYSGRLPNIDIPQCTLTMKK
jgi:hypothetical protein